MTLLKSLALAKNWIPLFIILVVTLVVGSAYFNSGFPFTHDGENHLARFANYKIALREGQFPPRFAPNLFNRYGYPVFNYNYPLANVVSVPFSFAKLNYELTFKIIALVSVFGAGLGAFNFSRSLKFGENSSLIAASTYITTPYLISLVNFRGNIGEIMALALIPWVLYLQQDFYTSKRKVRVWKLVLYIVGLAAFFLSHNVAVLMLTPVLIAHLLWLSWLKKWPGEKIKIVSGAGLLSFLMSMWFWLPALLEKNQVILDTSDISNQVLDHFVTFKQLFFSPIEFGFSQRGPIDSLSLSLGSVLIVSLVFTSLYVFKSILNRERVKTEVAVFLILSWALIFLQLNWSYYIWQVLPVVDFIQFPWRLQMVLAIISVPVIAYAYERAAMGLKTVLVILILAQVLTALRTKPVDFFHKLNRDYDSFSQSTSTRNENLPKTFVFQDIGGWQPTAQVLTGTANIIVETWKGSYRTYQVEVKEPVVIVEPTMNFLGWQTWVSSDQQSPQQLDHYDDNQVAGRLAYKLEPGQYQVESKFTQWTAARIAGNTLSLLAIIFTPIFLYTRFKS